MKKSIVIWIIVLLFVSCSTNSNTLNTEKGGQVTGAELLFTDKDLEIEKNLSYNFLEARNKEVYIDSNITDSIEFYDMEYLLLIKDEAGYYNASGDAWYDYALLGGEYNSIEKGKALYEKINEIYSNKLPTRSQLVLNKETEEYIEFLNQDTSFINSNGYLRMINEYYISKISEDGTKVLCKKQLTQDGNFDITHYLATKLTCHSILQTNLLMIFGLVII